MELQTRKLIDDFHKAKSKDEIKELVYIKHQKIKSHLSKIGINFYDEQDTLSQDIQGGQTVHGYEDVEFARSYEEINYIRNGISKGWVTMTDEMQRFEPIKKEVQDIIENFK